MSILKWHKQTKCDEERLVIVLLGFLLRGYKSKNNFTGYSVCIMTILYHLYSDTNQLTKKSYEMYWFSCLSAFFILTFAMPLCYLWPFQFTSLHFMKNGGASLSFVFTLLHLQVAWHFVDMHSVSETICLSPCFFLILKKRNAQKKYQASFSIDSLRLFIQPCLCQLLECKGRWDFTDGCQSFLSTALLFSREPETTMKRFSVPTMQYCPPSVWSCLLMMQSKKCSVPNV